MVHGPGPTPIEYVERGAARAARRPVFGMIGAVVGILLVVYTLKDCWYGVSVARRLGLHYHPRLGAFLLPVGVAAIGGVAVWRREPKAWGLAAVATGLVALGVRIALAVVF